MFQKDSAEKTVRDIRHKTRRKFSAEKKDPDRARKPAGRGECLLLVYSLVNFGALRLVAFDRE